LDVRVFEDDDEFDDEDEFGLGRQTELCALPGIGRWEKVVQ